MGGVTQKVSYRSFRRVAIGTIIVFVLVFLFWKPISLYAANATGCEGVSGACGAVLLLIGLYGRLALTLAIGIVFGIIIALRSRTLGLPLVATLNGAFGIAGALTLTTSLNNFWAVGFVAGNSFPGSGSIFALLRTPSVGPFLVTLFILWNLSSSRRDKFFRNWSPDPFFMRALKWFSGLLLAGSLINLLGPALRLAGMAEFANGVAAVTKYPQLLLLAINALIGCGVICFLWYAIGRAPSENEAEPETWNAPEPA